MDELSFQQVFSRVYGYLTEAGVEMTSERCRQMLQLIDDAMADMGEEPGVADSGKSISGQRLLGNVMDLLPDYFPLPEISTPPGTPPLCRGSIGYRRYE